MKLMAAGDQVLVAEFGDRIDEAVNDQVHALAAKIEEQQIPGIGETGRSVQRPCRIRGARCTLLPLWKNVPDRDA